MGNTGTAEPPAGDGTILKIGVKLSLMKPWRTGSLDWLDSSSACASPVCCSLSLNRAALRSKSACSPADNVSLPSPSVIGVILLDESDEDCCLYLSKWYVPPFCLTFCLNSKSWTCLCNILCCCSFNTSRWSNPSKNEPSLDALKNAASLLGNGFASASFSFIKPITSLYVGRVSIPNN